MRYFSRGKILLSGEYAVLFGAKALALPSYLGQYLEINEIPGQNSITVKSYLNDDQWFDCTLSLPGFDEVSSSDPMVCSYVRNLFLAASEMKPGFFNGEKSYELISTLEFDTRWGLGSSSSLISNIAFWLEIDPFELSWKMSPGSGYDIACARSSFPMIYQLLDQKPIQEKSGFNPVFKDNLYFVYLGNKQDSQYSVKDFRERILPDKGVIENISRISTQMALANSLETFEELMSQHEETLAAYLGHETVKKSRFPGFKGAMKSLGAWGGDLVLVTWKDTEEALRRYFDAKGLRLVFRFDDLIHINPS